MPLPIQLALRVLEAFARPWAAVFLPFMLAGIASEESLLFHDLTKFHVEFLQRARNSQANRLCLSGQSAAMRQDQQIEFPSRLGGEQRLLNFLALARDGEVILGRPPVDLDLPVSGPQEYSCDGGLSPPRSQVLNCSCR